MISSDEKLIEISKGKIFLHIVGCFLFFCVCSWIAFLRIKEIILDEDYFSYLLFESTVLVITAGIFFSFMLMHMKHLKTCGKGLILNSEGITNDSGDDTAFFAPWKDITGFGIHTVEKRKFIMVLVTHPERYTKRDTKNKFFYKYAKSPLLLPSSILKINFDDLLKLCKEYYQKYNVNSKSSLDL